MVKKSYESKFKVTPWDVSGNVNYNKLIKDFGVSKLDNVLLDRLEKLVQGSHFMLNRKVFFAHRDLKWLLDEYEKGNKFFLYTGCGPSGPLHLGHLQTWIFTKWLQDVFDVELWFQFTDDEKFLFKKNLDYEDVQKWVYENMLDVIALGFNPKKTHFIINTKHASLVYPEAIKIAKKITYSTVKSSFGFDDSRNIGEIFYTSMQAAPVLIPGILKKNKKIPCLIPLAIDQDPHFRIARDVYPKLKYPKPAILHGMFLPPLTGMDGKMSSSDSGKAILTTDSPDAVRKKINKYAFSGGQASVEEHRKKGGNPDIDVSFQYLRMLFEPDEDKLNKIRDKYSSGEMLTSELKAYLIEKINSFLAEHQKKREEAKKRIDEFLFKP
ncbi:tryptophan--tRNA ligase [Candidatus Pacearchaeota archaeon]|nr:tryptophan--tRNA ligase [Candidatus Pacearchaeota archaeon]